MTTTNFQKDMNLANEKANETIETYSSFDELNKREQEKLYAAQEWVNGSKDLKNRLEVFKRFPNGFSFYNEFASLVINGKGKELTKYFTLNHVNTNRHGDQWVAYLEVDGVWRRYASDFSHRYSDTKAIDAFEGSPAI
jgi:hypothetical protein